MRREPIERPFDQVVVSDDGWARRQAVEPGGALTVIGEQAVDVCAEHAAVGRDRALRRAIVESRKWPRTIGPGSRAHMHLVTGKRRAASGLAPDRLKPLAIGQNGFNLEQTKAGNFSRRTLDALRVGNRAPQHLITAAQAEHQAAAAAMRGDIDVKAA